MKELKDLLLKALQEIDYLVIESEEEREELRKLANDLSIRIRKRFGEEVPIWYLANRILRAIEDAQLAPLP